MLTFIRAFICQMIGLTLMAPITGYLGSPTQTCEFNDLPLLKREIRMDRDFRKGPRPNTWVHKDSGAIVTIGRHCGDLWIDGYDINGRKYQINLDINTVRGFVNP